MTTLKKNLFSIKFEDADLKDDAQGLRLKLESEIDNNHISVAVTHAKAAFKIVAGETHQIKLTPSSDPLDSTRTYYLDIPKNNNLRHFAFQLKHHSNANLVYTLQKSTASLSDLQLQSVSLDQTTDSETGLTLVDQDLGTEGGHYLLKIKNLDKDSSAMVSFRFSLDKQKEIEENGMLSGYLQPGHSEHLELMITQPGDLKMLLKTCGSPMLSVYLDSISFVEGENKAAFPIMSTGDTGSALLFPPEYSQYFVKSKPVYLKVDNKGDTPAEYTLITNFDTLGTRGMASDFFIVLPVQAIYPVPKDMSLIVELFGPAIDQNSLKALYPNMTTLKITIQVMIFIGDILEIHQKMSTLENNQYCKNLPFVHDDYYNGSVTYNVDVSDLLSSQKSRNVSVKLSPDAARKVDIRDINTLINVAGSAVIRARINVHEDNNFDAVATFVKYSNSTLLQLGTIASAIPVDPRTNEIVSNMLKILLLLVTLLVMLAVLLVFYLCANKISGAYRPMSAMEVDPSVQTGTGKALEMVEGIPERNPADDTTTTLDASAATI